MRPSLQPCSYCDLPRRPTNVEPVNDRYEIASMTCLRCQTVVRLVRKRRVKTKSRASFHTHDAL